MRLIESVNSFIIGEMAHVIAKSPSGARGEPNGGSNDYSNLILLCPNHHRLIDKAASDYPVAVLQNWKQEWEQHVESTLASPKYITLSSLARSIEVLLDENKQIWSEYGPESDLATNNPFSNQAEYWIALKLDTIIPNNTRILNMIDLNMSLIDSSFSNAAMNFRMHATAFERSCYERLDYVPRFPPEFESFVKKNAK